GIEKAERNVLPILNNLLENREMYWYAKKGLPRIDFAEDRLHAAKEGLGDIDKKL
ncbi:18056_t:CDS:2, partial [Racocetra persica]